MKKMDPELKSLKRIAREFEGWRDIDDEAKTGAMLLIAFKTREGEPEVMEGKWDARQSVFTSRTGFILLDSAYAYRPLPLPPLASGGG